MVLDNRAQLARYGLMVGDLQNLIAMALGAEPVTTTVEGRERYAVSIRYPRDYRSDPQAIATEVLIPTADGGTVPLGQFHISGRAPHLHAEGRAFFGLDLEAASTGTVTSPKDQAQW